jgi:pyrimidine-nucleoside phosphorylase
MRMFDIIEKKKNKQELTKEEIKFVVENYTNGNIPDYQMSALLMAICINGMNDNEINYLTYYMLNSGDRIDLSMFNNTVDKHSTGGVGDKTTLIVTPIVASLGDKVAKMSGRGLGFTGGTVDKLESIKGYNISLTKDEFINQVRDINIALIGQSSSIALADKKIYALRDVTATVSSIPLIASSIMSKKIASGAKNLVLDVKVGKGAFMKDIESAKKLATQMVKIGMSFNINTVALLTNMDIPLGNNIGNILEVKEAIDVLNNKGPSDLREVSIYIATLMHSITNNISFNESYKMVINSINSGKAYAKFKELVSRQGGVLEFDNPTYEYKIYSKKEGYINSMDTERIGKISVSLGAGRLTKEDQIDYTAGIVINKKINDYVKVGDLIATFYSSKISDFKDLENEYLDCLNYSNEKIDTKLIYGIVGKINN